MRVCRYSRIAAASGKTAEAAGHEETRSSEAAPAAAAAATPSFEDIHRCASAQSTYSTTSDLLLPADLV